MVMPPTAPDQRVDQNGAPALDFSAPDDPPHGDPVTEDELTALALAADPDAPLSADAVPLSMHLAQFAGALPQWYMPPAMARQGSKWRLPVIGTIVAAFLLIEGLGLCNTYGILNFA
jgi:hypothetical protein